MVAENRWPPVYDWDGLEATVRRLADGTGALEYPFYLSPSEITPDFFQGDVLSLHADLPFLDENNQAATAETFDHWLLIGNTCDFARDENDAAWTQLVPILDLGPRDDHEFKALREFRTFRSFYVAPWREEYRGHVFAADFLRPCAIAKQALRNHARVEARLSRYGWMLLNSCLVRFYARDDGRHD